MEGVRERTKLGLGIALSVSGHALLLWMQPPPDDRVSTELVPALAAIELVDARPFSKDRHGRPSLPASADSGSARAKARPRSHGSGGNGPRSPDGEGPVAEALPLMGLRAPDTELRRDVVIDLSEVQLARRKQVAPTLEQTEAEGALLDRTFPENANGDRQFRDSGLRFRANLRDDGTVIFSDTPVSHDREHKRVVMEGPAEWIKRAGGQDPYAASKGRVLRETFDARLVMAREARLRELGHGLARLDADLLALWTDASMPATRRRRLLFERWDECEEPDPLAPAGFAAAGASVDRERRRAGAAARRRIEAFVREHLPQGSEHAYPGQELRLLNAGRTSHERFDPYRHR